MHSKRTNANYTSTLAKEPKWNDVCYDHFAQSSHQKKVEGNTGSWFFTNKMGWLIIHTKNVMVSNQIQDKRPQRGLIKQCRGRFYLRANVISLKESLVMAPFPPYATGTVLNRGPSEWLLILSNYQGHTLLLRSHTLMCLSAAVKWEFERTHIWLSCQRQIWLCSPGGLSLCVSLFGVQAAILNSTQRKANVRPCGKTKNTIKFCQSFFHSSTAISSSVPIE